ncbi:TetR/AcrR family transcriptional regulator [uncultured Roseobacter sp.]|uniref:TetR/AcrR family transcriptional regulator n=1 Tax=uncultured Roseobacter sp. TaxID=114847 RepID=UPI00261093F4|nr:TetR/AcrR family transcriptional regulator [uncultured Roseobacter sp.]
MPRRPTYDRDDLIDRARDLFWRQGWAGTSLKDLESELQMKPGSFYAAFGSKEGLFALALERYLRDGTARLAALASEVGALKALESFPKRVIESVDAPSKACMLSKTFLELQGHRHPLAQKADAYLSEMEKSFADLFAQAQSDGDIDPSYDPHLLAQKYQSDLLGLRASAERSTINAIGIADEIAASIARLGQAIPLQ